MALKSFLFTFDYWQTRAQTESEQNRCAMACQGCGAVLFFSIIKRQWQFLLTFDIVKLPHKTIQYRKTPLPMKRIPFDLFSDKRFYANASWVEAWYQWFPPFSFHILRTSPKGLYSQGLSVFLFHSDFWKDPRGFLRWTPYKYRWSSGSRTLPVAFWIRYRFDNCDK